MTAPRSIDPSDARRYGLSQYEHGGGFSSPKTSINASSDVDLFIYGLNRKGADAKLAEKYEAISARSSSPVLAVKSQHAVTFVQNYPRRHIQVITRIYSSPAEVRFTYVSNPVALRSSHLEYLDTPQHAYYTNNPTRS